MIKYNPRIHHRRSIRLKGYDYSKPGLYFITFGIQNRLHLFGEIIHEEMILNDAGKSISKWYYELENKFTSIKCHEMIVMPNHFHCIIEITNFENIITSSTININFDLNYDYENKILSEHNKSPLGKIVQWFKTMTTNEYIRGVKTKNWQRFEKRLWQRNYWEHIIRNERSYLNISNYIKNNPAKWQQDKLNNK
ncbi:MAG: transposase [Ichthyobacteriaceae bacterium]|nr:transposase [Ichthyobacteriaceae bacterium]